MRLLSARDVSLTCEAGIEVPSGGGGIGVSTGVRKYWRKHFQSVSDMQGTNDQVNYMISLDYSNATPVHRFLLKSGEIGEIRKSHSFYYIGAIRKNNRHDVIVIQTSFREAPEQIKSQRLTKEWLEGVMSGKIQRKHK